ncbi:MAG: trypsin-like peptidase domain-containing protein [Massilia sp.]|nr:trypsin-like peptidase domain-containing protein [Massilia sp.]
MHNEGAVTAITAKRLTLALCAAGVIGGAVGAIAVEHNNATAAAAAATTPAPSPAPATVAATPAPVAGNPVAGTPAAVALPDFTQIVSHNGPAVVNVRVVGTTKVSQRQMPQFDEDDPFFEFFRRFQPQQPRGGGRGELVYGAGSGFIVSPDGVILTNAHVVRDADEVTVKLQDRREFRAKVLGSDPKTDVAVLKIEAKNPKNLPVVPIGNTRNLQVGEWVLAIGSPYGLESSVTAGVVSGKGRSLPNYPVPFIQTDVAVRIKDQIVANGKVQHAKLGVVMQDVNQDFADSFKLESPDGALVANVERGGPADKAGIKAGDVIRKVNGQPIISYGDLSGIVSVAKPGDRMELDVWRDGKIIHVNTTLANANDKPERIGRDNLASNDRGAKLGLALRPLDPMERRQAGLPAGLVIEDAGGAAQAAGVQPGDLLLAVNGRPVSSVAQVREVVSKSTKTVALLIQRGDDKIFIPVRIG